jgi:hypothetical protein
MTTAAAIAHPRGAVDREHSATRTVVATFGFVLSIAGLEHGIGEILEGPVAPPGLVFRSWPDAAPFEILGGEPAMTIVPNLLVAGTLTVVVSVAFAVWSVGYAHRPRGAAGLLVLSIALLLLGGGLAPPVIGVILAFVAARMGTRGGAPGTLAGRIAPAWRGALMAGVVGYMGLFPGTVLASGLFGFESELIVLTFGVLAFGGLFAAIAAARAHDRLVAHGVASGT